MALNRLPANAQQQSPLFKLPPELRNHIYEKVFECHDDDTVDLATAFKRKPESPHKLGAATPPSSALLKTCQVIRNESTGIFEAESEAFWDKEFLVVLRGRHWGAPYVTNIPNAYLSRISNITFARRTGPLRIQTTWSWSDDIFWCVQHSQAQPGWDIETSLGLQAPYHSNAHAIFVAGRACEMFLPKALPPSFRKHLSGNPQFWPISLRRLDATAMEYILEQFREVQDYVAPFI